MPIIDDNGTPWFNAGFAIMTTDQFVIEDNAREDYDDEAMAKMPLLLEMEGRELPQKLWDILNEDFIILEKNLLKVLKKYTNIQFREEGHDGDGDLVGSIWVKADNVQDMKFIMRNSVEVSQEPTLEMYDLDNELFQCYGLDLPNVWHEVYEGTSEYCQHLVDVGLDFIGIEKDEFEKFEEAMRIFKGESIWDTKSE